MCTCRGETGAFIGIGRVGHSRALAFASSGAGTTGARAGGTAAAQRQLKQRSIASRQLMMITGAGRAAAAAAAALRCCRAAQFASVQAGRESAAFAHLPSSNHRRQPLQFRKEKR